MVTKHIKIQFKSYGISGRVCKKSGGRVLHQPVSITEIVAERMSKIVVGTAMLHY